MYVYRLVSMNENSWQHWRVNNVLHVTLPPLSFPWMKIHGNIEGDENLCSLWNRIGCFHEWKFMATLKASGDAAAPCQDHAVSMNENSWQHWRKTAFYILDHAAIGFPWMKIHGNIEGLMLGFFVFLSWWSFHEWKFMATLKVQWAGACRIKPVVSMNENSWQHWRIRSSCVFL